MCKVLFYNVWLCLSFGFIICVFVCKCSFCYVCVCVFFGFVICGLRVCFL